MGAPVFGSEGEVPASVSMAVPERRCLPEATEEFVRMLRQTACAIGEDMARLEGVLGLGGQKKAEPSLEAAAG